MYARLYKGRGWVGGWMGETDAPPGRVVQTVVRQRFKFVAGGAE